MKKRLLFIVAIIVMITLASCSNTNSGVQSESTVPMETQTINPTSKLTEPPTEDQRNVVVSTEEYTIAAPDSGNLAGYAFNSDGVAWVSLSKGNNKDKSLALINTNQEVLFILDDRFDNACAVTRFYNGVSAVYPKNNNGSLGTGFILVDQDGNEIFSSIDENINLCGCDADGRFYVARHDAGFDHDAWYIGFVDLNGLYTDLGIEVPEGIANHFQETIELTDQLVYFWSSYGYYGYLNLVDSCWVHCTPNVMTILGANSESAIIENSGYFYKVPISRLSGIKKSDDIQRLLDGESSTYIVTNGVKGGLLYTNNNMGIERWRYSTWKDGSFYRKYWRTENHINKELHYDYLDVDGNLIFEYPTYTTSGVKYLKLDEFSGGFSAVYLLGVNGKRYVTVIDETGQAKYDPVELTYGLTDNDTSCSCNGYIFTYSINRRELEIISPDGTNVDLGDNMSDLKDGYCTYDERFSLAIGNSYMFVSCNGEYKYYAVDGSRSFNQVTACYNNNGELVYTDQNGNKTVNSLRKINSASFDETTVATENSSE